MKTMKRFASVLLALVMVMGMTVTSFADETTYTLTIDAPEGVSIVGHTYEAYQIFAGDLSGDTLSNIVWGDGVNTEAEGFNLGDAAAKADSLETSADAEAFAAAVAPYLGTAAGSAAVDEGKTSCEITGLKAGYYLIKTSAVPEKDGAYTYYMMKIVKSITATVKADVPEVEKSVNDNDANISDTVTFTLTATMPSNIQGYEKYKVIFHDTLSDGLAYVGNVTVTVDGNDKTSEFTPNHNNGILTISCNDVLAASVGATASSKIVVTYDAKLDSDAVIGTEGNPNKVYLEYSNNPNWDGEGNEPTGKTPEDEVKVYTWEIPVFKYTGTDTPLAGAGFTLYDEGNVVKLTKGEGNIYKVDPNGAVTEIITDDTGRFEIEGLEQGEYILKESTTPAGYNTVGDITVTIGADGVLTVDQTTVTEVKVLNQSGATLPETGGIGTTIFYALGAALMLGAGVLLVTKKRMGE